jgi:DNA-binding MarR family transcriptional regulator
MGQGNRSLIVALGNYSRNPERLHRPGALRGAEVAMAADVSSPADAPGVAGAMIERELSLLLRRWRAYHLALAEEVHPGLKVSTYATLLYILKGDGVRAADIAAYYGIDKGPVSRQIRQLEDLGLITREAAPDDGRAQVLVPTPYGREQFEEARSKRSGRLHQELAGWEPADLQTFALLLARFNAALNS